MRAGRKAERTAAREPKVAGRVGPRRVLMPGLSLICLFSGTISTLVSCPLQQPSSPAAARQPWQPGSPRSPGSLAASCQAAMQLGRQGRHLEHTSRHGQGRWARQSKAWQSRQSRQAGQAGQQLHRNGPIKWALYCLGCIACSFQFFLNGKQILEHSDEEETIWQGDSEFRKASLLLIVTWFPFPIWYILSPEGVGLINDVLIIQMGWAFLNILSKFSFIFYIQRVKDNYCNRLKVRRELLGTGTKDDGGLEGMMAMMGIAPGGDSQMVDKDKQRMKELSAVVVETMTFLGMAQHNDRFI